MEPAGRPTPRPIWEPLLRPEPAALVVLALVRSVVVGSVEVGFGMVEEVGAASLVDGVFCGVESPGEPPVGLAGAPVAIAMLDDPAETVDVAVARDPFATSLHAKSTATGKA